jgi:SAM-dependent methyltransferase
MVTHDEPDSGHRHDHDRGHAHGHDGGHDHDGRSFDERARDWDDEEKVERARIVAAAIRAAVTPDDHTRVLEYGAGTGLATQFLAQGPLGPVTLADPSAGMREVMAEKAADGRLPAGASIVDLALDDAEKGDPPRGAFDLVVTVMALHHVPDPRAVLAGFGAVLARGGRLCIVDLVAEDGSFHADTDFDVHDGFDEAELTAWLVDEGFEDVTFDTVHELDKDGRSYPLFLATARRA